MLRSNTNLQTKLTHEAYSPKEYIQTVEFLVVNCTFCCLQPPRMYTINFDSSQQFWYTREIMVSISLSQDHDIHDRILSSYKRILACV